MYCREIPKGKWGLDVVLVGDKKVLEGTMKEVMAMDNVSVQRLELTMGTGSEEAENEAGIASMADD